MHRLRSKETAMTIRQRLEQLRNEALEALRQTAEFRAFAALDDAVAALGGDRLGLGPLRRSGANAAAAAPVRKRLTQADAAERVLKEAGEPLATPALLDRIAALGVAVGGADPETNLSSSLSRDRRFVSVRIRGRPAWWLEGQPLPMADAEAEGILAGLASAPAAVRPEGR